MAVAELISKVTMDGTWTSLDLNGHNHFYLIAIKGDKENGDVIDPKEVDQITFEIAVDSGVEDKPITTQFVSLNFNEFTSSDKAFNEISAFKRILNSPEEIYIRPVSVHTVDDKTLTTGEVAIVVNVGPVTLGDA
mgnify:CR=1 FL=1